jgi:hypothetical protein
LHLGPKCAYRYFPEDITHAVLFGETVSISYWNSTRIAWAIFERKKKSFYFLGSNWRVPIFGARKFIFTGHRPMTYQTIYSRMIEWLLNNELERMCNKEVMIWVEVLSWQLPRATEETHDKHVLE